MAPGMKWLASVVVCCALIAVLVPRIDFEVLQVGMTDETRELVRLGNQMAEEDRLARHYFYADTLLPLVSASPDFQLHVLHPIGGDTEARLRTGAAQRMAAIDPTRAKVALFVVPPTLGASTAVYGDEMMFYAGARDNVPYCVSIVVGRMSRDSASMIVLPLVRSDFNGLGPCFWWAKYGAPGPRIATWLRASGYHFGTSFDRPRIDHDRVERRGFARRAFHGELSLLATSCVGGRRDHCEQVLRVDESRRGQRMAEPVIFSTRIFHSRSFGSFERNLLHDLEVEFGAERFARFWQSNEDMESAFASAFGLPLGEWVQRWAQTRFGVIQTNAGMDAATVLLSLLTLLVLGAAAIIEAQRRQIR
jgi:hypothetical protein